MKSTIFALTLAGAASAHTTVWNVLVNGKDQGVGNIAGGYIDTPPNNSPVTDVTSKDIECNVAGTKASKSIPANPGDELAFQWHHDTNSPSDDIIASSHRGPIMVYVSKAGSPMSWTKVWEDKAITDGKYAVDRLNAGTYTGTKGQHNMKIPAGLAPGDYIFRPEILALHEGSRANGAQFYMECVHVTVGGSGSTALPAGVSFPGAYKQDEPGVMFNIYGTATTYPGVGPAVWSGAAGSVAGSAPEAAAPATSPSPAADPAAPATSPSPSEPAAEPPAPATSPSPAAEPPAPATTPSPAPVAADPATQPSTMATVAKPAETPAPGAGAGAATAQRYAQCGGNGYTGATACASGATCTKQNDYYSQCI